MIGIVLALIGATAGFLLAYLVIRLWDGDEHRNEG